MRASSPFLARRLRKFQLRAAALAAAACCGGMISHAQGDTWTWNGGGSPNFNWSGVANWTHTGGASAPISSVDTTISFASSSGVPVTQDIANPMLLNSLNFQAGAGAFQISGGALDFANSSASIAPTIVQNSASGDVLVSNITLNNGTTVSGSGAGGLIFNNVISGGGSLNFTGGGNMILIGNNTYSGGTLISGGTVVLSSSHNLGSGNLTFNSGTLIAGNTTLISNFTVNSSTASFQASAGTTFVINPTSATFGSMNFGSATNTGTINFEPGSFTWFGGTINVNGGTLLDGANALAQTLSSYTVNIASGATLNLNGFSSTINNLTGSGNFAIGTDASQNVTLTSGNFSGIISGAGSLITTGSTVILSGPNTYTGGSILGGGNFGAGNNAAFGAQAVLVTGNTSLYAVGSTITLANQFVFSTAKSLTIINNPGGAQNLILSGNISGNGGIIMSGTGSLKLSGNNSYSGNTTLNSGELIINNNNSLGSGGTLNLIGGIVTASADATISGNYTDQSATSPITFRAVAATTLTLGGSLHFGSQTVNFGGVGFTGTVNFSPGTGTGFNFTMNVNAGTLLDGNGLLPSFLNAANLTVASGATLDLNGDTATIKNLLGAGNVATGTSAAEHLTLITANFSGNITGSGQLFTASNSTSVILSGANTYTGNTTLAGGTLGFGNNSALGTHDISVTGNTSLYAANADHTLANNISLSTTLTVTDDPTGVHNLTLSGSITGAGGITMNGTGNLTLSGSNSYAGDTTLNSGTIIINSTQNLGNNSGTSIVNGGTIHAAGNATISNVDNTSATSPVTFEAAPATTLTIIGGFNFGTGNINFGSSTATGTVSLAPGAGTISFGAHYNVNGGTLLDGSGNLNTILAHGFVTIAPGATVDFSTNSGGFGDLLGSGTVKTGSNPGDTLTVEDASFSGNVTGPSTFTTKSDSLITLSGASSYTGGTNFAGGSIGAGNNSAFGSGNISVTASTSLYAFTADRTLVNPISINSGQTLTIQDDPSGAHNLTLGGAVSGTGTLAMTGNGTLTLTSTLTEGSLSIGNVSRPSKVVFSGGNSTVNKLGSLSLSSTSTLDLTSTRLIIEDSSASRSSDLGTYKADLSTNQVVSSSAVLANLLAGRKIVTVALVDNAVAHLSTFGGQSVDANSILVSATFEGDANVDGMVDLKDLQALANHWQQNVTDWSQGDFDGNGKVELQDLQAIANDWQDGVPAGGGGGGQSFSEALSLIGGFGGPTAVPEPASLLVLAPLLLSRRRGR